MISCYYFYASRMAALRLGLTFVQFSSCANFIYVIYLQVCCLDGIKINYEIIAPYCNLQFISYHMYFKPSLLSNLYRLRPAPFLVNRVSYGFGYVAGSNFSEYINVSTSRHMKDMTQRYSSSILINSLDQDQQLTYEQVLSKAQQLATGLIKTFNLKPKDRIGLYAYNKSQWVIIQLAAAIADLILVNINPNYQSQELAFTLQKVGVSVLFLNDQFKSLNYIQVVKNIIPDIEHRNPLHLNSPRLPQLKGVVRINSKLDHFKGFANITDLYQPAQSSLLNYNVDTNDPANIQFTSGTTGRPKAATLSHYNILNNALVIGNKLKYTHADNITIPVPFYHCFGMIMGTLAAIVRGCALTIVCQGFDPKKTLSAVNKYKCTSLYGVPTMFIQYLRHYQQNPSHYDISHLRAGIVAGAVCSQALMTKIINTLNLRDMTNCYGMTQTSPVSFQTCPTDPFHRKTTTVGKILPGLEAKIVNSKGQTCKPGQPGQFWVRGWSVMLNYWGDEVATQKSIQEGWMKSGDLGVIDEQGYLSIVGRIKDMIIRGGENIYPKQIEEYLVKMEGILDAQVVAVTDQKYGEQVGVVIKVKDLSTNHVNAQDVFEFCKGKIANYKIPTYVKFVSDYPMTVSGKVQKFILREQFEKDKKSGKIETYRVNTKKVK